jgi:hypothetical protein
MFRLADRARRWLWAVTLGVPAVLLAAALLQPWAEPRWLFLDPLAAAELSGDCCHTWYGFVSNIGVLTWAVSAGGCGLAALLLWSARADAARTRFAATAAGLLGWLAMDDALMLHENVLPGLGVPQNFVHLFIILLTLTHLGLNLRILRQSEYGMLLLGGGALFGSVAVDVVLHSLLPSMIYLEDGAKLVGLFCWCSFHVSTAFVIARGVLVPPAEPGPHLDRERV